MKISLTQSLFIPLIDYGEVCYYDLNAGLLNKRDHLLNNCMQFIFNLLMYDHISALRSQLKWLTIRQRRSQQVFLVVLQLPIFTHLS